MGVDIVFSLGFRHPIFLSIPVIDVYTREKPTHTSGLSAVSASWAGTLRWSDSVAVCGNDAWASAIRVTCLGPGKRFPSLRPGSGMSTTVGGRSRRSKAAASGRVASMASRVSGRAARGSGYMIPGLYRPASLA